MRKPDFDNLLAVLKNEKPKRPTLFEFFMNEKLYEKVTGIYDTLTTPLELQTRRIKAFEKIGYDYTTVHCSFGFPRREQAHGDTISQNEGVMITDRKSFEEYPWPDPDAHDYSLLEQLLPAVPEGMKLIVCGPGGVLENVISLIGYDNLCFMSIDEPELLQDICDAIGSRLTRHYELAGQHDIVGAMISNDDWGFKTQTMISPDDMRKYIIPWHCRISKAIHNSGKPAILHSCGNLKYVMDDIIDVIKYEGKHSYEDTICPVEEAYEKWGDRIAILGGIDLDFICRNTPQTVYERSKKMLELADNKGGYAMGSGNSIPEYVPYDNYMAMIKATTGE
jgi:uroporphyrinogen decarboxylase